jgi:hypothetical protein
MAAKMILRKDAHALPLALALAIISYAGYYFPLAGMAVAVVALVLARKALATGQRHRLAMATLLLAICGFIFCVVVQIYLLATFHVG